MNRTPLDEIGRLKAFNEIFIVHSRYTSLRKRLSLLMRQTRSVIEANGDSAYQGEAGFGVGCELWVFRVQGPTGATKSTSLKRVCRELSENSNHKQPVLTVTLDSNIRSCKQLQSRILQGFGDEGAAKVLTMRDYRAAAVNDSIMAIARDRGTALVVLDEVHNTLPLGRGATATAMARAMRSLVNQGVFSLVLSGTDEMGPLFCDPELLSRTKEPVYFGPTDLTADLPEFFAFTQALCREMYAKGVIDAPFDPLGSQDECAMLFDMTGGVIGMVSRLLRLSVEHALYDDRTSIDWSDLRFAYENWRAGQKSPRPSLSTGARRETINAVSAMLRGPGPKTAKPTEVA